MRDVVLESVPATITLRHATAHMTRGTTVQAGPVSAPVDIHTACDRCDRTFIFVTYIDIVK